MKRNQFIMLVLFGVFITSCSTTADFDVKTVDAVSQSPIQGVRVEQHATHYTGVKSLVMEDNILGKTNTRGVQSVGKLNMYSREYTFSFKKAGYETVDLVIFRLSGQHTYAVAKRSSSEKIVESTALSKSTVITIPMRRR